MAMPGSSARRLGIPSTMMESPTAVTSPPPCAGDRAVPGWVEEGTDWDRESEAGSPEGWVGLIVETGTSELDVAPRAVQAPVTETTASRMAAWAARGRRSREGAPPVRFGCRLTLRAAGRRG